MTEIETDLPVDDLTTAEAELERKERWLGIEMDRVRGIRREVNDRITKARASAEDAQLKSVLGEMAVPSVNVRTNIDESRLARLKAIAVRKGCFEKARDAVRAHEAELDSITKRVRDEEQAAKARVVQKPIPAPAPKPKPMPEPEAHDSLHASIEQALEAKAAAHDDRAHSRARLCAEISLGSDSNLFTGFTNDVSEGGVFVATVNLMPIGTHVDFSFNLPGGQQVEGRGEVRWVRDIDDKHPDVFPGMGIRFIDVPLPSVGAIKAFAAEREPMFFPD